MSTSNPNTTTTNTTNSVPDWLVPNLQQIAGGAQNLYNQGVGPEYYPQQTWTGFNPMQEYALQAGAQIAGSNDLQPRAEDTLGNIMDSGGISNGGYAASQPIVGIADGQNQINTGAGYAGMLNGIGGGNPYFQQQLNDQTNRTANQVDAQFSLGGRYGSGAQADALATSIGKVRTDALSNQYNSDIGNMYQGLAGLTGVQSTNIGNQYNAANNLEQLYQGGQGDAFRASLAAPTLAQSRYNDLNQLFGIGQQYQGMEQNQLNDSMNSWNFNNSQPWNQLGMYAQTLQGINAGSKGTSVTQGPQPSFAQSLFGPAAIGAGIGQAAFPGIGGVLGGLGGGLVGLGSRYL